MSFHYISSNHFRIILLDDAMDCLISFSDFLFAFQLQFYYEGKVLYPADLGALCI